jgi:Dockerin type I domain
MRTLISIQVAAVLALAAGTIAQAECPLDHLTIGCNRDGVEGTADDHTLFVDCSQKYRDSGQTKYANWFYPLNKSIFPSYSYRIGEPGFDIFQSTDTHASYTYDPNRALAGEPDIDYSIVVECVAMSPGLRAVHKEYPQFTIGETGDRFNHSYIHGLRGDGHMHMSYQATDGETLHWITFRLYDGLDDGAPYESSEPFTIVFNTAPAAGDLVVDGIVDMADLAQLTDCWLASDCSRQNDYCERADANRDGVVDVFDFALLASNWLIPEEKPL